MRRASGIVVHSTCQNMRGRSTPPPIGLPFRSRLSSILLDLTALCPSEPIIMSLERLVYFSQVGQCKVWISQIFAFHSWELCGSDERSLKAHACVKSKLLVGKSCGSRSFPDTFDEVCNSHRKRWRIGIVGYLSLKFGRNLEKSLLFDKYTK